MFPKSSKASMIVAALFATLVGTAPAQDSCTSSEFGYIKDPAVLGTLPSNDAIVQAARSAGGVSQLDQMITSMHQMHDQAASNLAIAEEQVRATAAGDPEPVSPSQCAAMKQNGGTANKAAHCEVLTFTDMLHFSTGYLEVLECLKRNWQG
jgi:hypothetical protein